MRLLFFVVLGVLIASLWRSGRRSESSSTRTRTPRQAPGPQPMVRCARCGVHLPQSEAVAGRAGLYCGAEHRQQAEP